MACTDCGEKLATCTCIEDPTRVEKMSLAAFRWRMSARSETIIPDEVMESLYADRVVAAQEGQIKRASAKA